MIPLLILGFIAATAEGYSLAADMQNDTLLCFDLRASRVTSIRHGPPENTEPSNFIKFEAKKENDPVDDIFDIKIELENDIEDSFVGWAIQVREYGNDNVGSNESFAFGSVAAYTGISEGWNCPVSSGNKIRNGIVHANGILNDGADIRTIEFRWTHVSTESQTAPTCAKVVATIMTAKGNWWHAAESECFAHIDNDGSITEQCPAECDEASHVLF